MEALSYAGCAVVGTNCFQCLWDSSVKVKSYSSHETVESILIENCFHFAENGLNRIKFWTVAHIEDRHDIKLLVKWLNIISFMHIQVIHQECKSSLRVSAFQLFEKIGEFYAGYRLCVDLTPRHSFPLCHRRDHRAISDVDVVLLDGEVRICL